MTSTKIELPRQFGPYALLKMLNKGGMGEIYLARTQGITGFEKYYAIKKLLKKFAHDNDVGARFIDEAKLGARLQHPNIVQVYDLGRVGDELFMATEFVDGFDLRRVLRFCHEKKKRIPLDIALFIVREVLSGLAYAHRQVDADGNSINLIHRDISPQNVLVSFEGEVKIIDFGLAKSTQRSQETQANVLLGNFGYMSPEQARGQPLDLRTDVYSAGIVLFELATGTKRFVEENPLRLLEMVARPTPIVPSDRIPGSPRALDKITAKATSAARDDRYQSADAFRDEVNTALYRLNPKASRENVAQFLNHLFLGGQAPPSVDDDVLNRSVAIQVKDLFGDMAAFTAPAADDVKVRALADPFSDDAPQTGSLPMLRGARLGDQLSHEQITGEMPPTLDALDDAPATPDAFEPVQTAQLESIDSMSPLSSSDGAVIDVLDVQPAQPSLYDAPAWPQGLAPPAPFDPRAEQEAEVQRQLDAQLALQRRVEEQQRQQQEAQRLEAQRLEAQRRAEEQQRQQQEAQRRAQLEQQRLEQQRLEQQRLEQQRALAAMSTPRTPAMPVMAARRPSPAPTMRPSIMLSPDLEPSEPTVVGGATVAPPPLDSSDETMRNPPAHMAFGEGGISDSLIIEVDSAEMAIVGTPLPADALPSLDVLAGAPRASAPIPPRAPSSAFRPPEPPPPDAPYSSLEDLPGAPAIRPAARPMGKGVAAPRRPVDDSPNAMPPPTRRR